VQLTPALFNQPVPALVTCLPVFPLIGFTLRQKIRYFEHKDL
jgi:hypothetical protein